MKEQYVYRVLGLRDPDLFALEQIRRNITEEQIRELGPARCRAELFRRTGRTTHNIVRAICYVVRTNRATVVSDQADPEVLRRLLDDFLDRLGCPELRDLIVVPRARPTSPDHRICPDGMVVELGLSGRWRFLNVGELTRPGDLWDFTHHDQADEFVPAEIGYQIQADEEDDVIRPLGLG